jgi:crotonobetainyl-CoA:carnitine CoA-transferase CaiB-like acyl-CoA transferase
MVGEHGPEILAEYGLSAERIAELEAKGDMTVERA